MSFTTHDFSVTSINKYVSYIIYVCKISLLKTLLFFVNL